MLCIYLHPAGQPEHDPVFAVHCHTVHQRGPQALIESGDALRMAAGFNHRLVLSAFL